MSLPFGLSSSVSLTLCLLCLLPSSFPYISVCLSTLSPTLYLISSTLSLSSPTSPHSLFVVFFLLSFRRFSEHFCDFRDFREFCVLRNLVFCNCDSFTKLRNSQKSHLFSRNTKIVSHIVLRNFRETKFGPTLFPSSPPPN
jgi:hypothetical protein